MAELCRESGISRKTGYKIFDRYQECGVQGLTDRSRRPYRYGRHLPFQLENYILNVKREHPSWGARKIRERLIRRFSDLTIPGKSTNPDVVLLDVAMPNLNGFEAAEIIKKYLPSATIFFVTQYDSLEMARATAEAGARGYIAKVYIPTDLVPAIEAAIDFPPIESPAL